MSVLPDRTMPLLVLRISVASLTWIVPPSARAGPVDRDRAAKTTLGLTMFMSPLASMIAGDAGKADRFEPLRRRD